jgi:hypothetical protein
MMQEGRRDQQKRDMTIGALGQMSEYLKVNADPSQEKFKSELLQNYYGRVDKLSKQLTEGANPDQILGALTAINREWQTDETRRELETGFIQGQAHRQTKRQQMAQGKWKPWLDPVDSQYQTNLEGQFQPIRFEGMESYLDPTNAMGKIFGNITASSNLGTKVNIDEESGRVTSVRQGVEEITPEDVTEVAQASADFFLRNSDEGRQYAIKLQATNPDITDEQIFQEATRDMYNLNMEQIFKKGQLHEDIQFPSSLQGEKSASPPEYERLFEEEADIPLPISTKDLKKGITKGSGETSVSQGYGASFKVGEAEKGYPVLTGEKKHVYESIVKAMNPDTQNMSEGALTEYLAGDEAHEIATNYIENLQQQVTAPSVNVAPFEKEADYNFAKRQIKVNTSGRVFYDAENGKTIMPDTRKWRKLNQEIQSNKFEVQGDMDYKNFVTLRTGNENFASSWSMKLVDPDTGREKQFVVTKKASDLEGERGGFEKKMNKIFTKTMQLPGVPQEYEYETQSGKKQLADVTYDPTNNAWKVELRSPYKDQQIGFYTNQLGDLHDRIALEMQNINAQ